MTRFELADESDNGDPGDTSFATEPKDPQDMLYANNLLFSFMCSAAKSLKEPIEDEVETRARTGSDTLEQHDQHFNIPLASELGHPGPTPGQLWFGFESEQEAFLCMAENWEQQPRDFPSYFGLTQKHWDVIRPNQVASLDGLNMGHVNEQDMCGCRPLHYGVPKEVTGSLHAYFNNDVNPCLRDSRGYTAIDYALMFGGGNDDEPVRPITEWAFREMRKFAEERYRLIDHLSSFRPFQRCQ